MYEIAAVIGLAGVILPVLIYNTRKISKIEDKVDLIYKNININIQWRKHCAYMEGREDGMEDKEI